MFHDTLYETALCVVISGIIPYIDTVLVKCTKAKHSLPTSDYFQERSTISLLPCTTQRDVPIRKSFIIDASQQGTEKKGKTVGSLSNPNSHKQKDRQTDRELKREERGAWLLKAKNKRF